VCMSVGSRKVGRRHLCVRVWVLAREGGQPESVPSPHLRRTHEYGNLQAHKRTVFFS
jgi:hypothetical protein